MKTNIFSTQDAKNVIAEMRMFYGKKFLDQWAGVDPKDLAEKMVQMFCDLNPDDLARGFLKMQTQAWPPTLPEFKAWCLGSSGGSLETNPVSRSYRGKYAAIANIEAWLSDSSITLTNAEREAYNRVYGMFDQLRWAYSDKKKFYAYEAFKDSYVEVVNESVAANICQFDSEPPEAIKPPELKVIRKDYLSTVSKDCDSEKTEQAIKGLVAQGMSVPEAYMSLAKANK